MHYVDGVAHGFTLSDRQRLGTIRTAACWDRGSLKCGARIDRHRRVESKHLWISISEYCSEFHRVRVRPITTGIPSLKTRFRYFIFLRVFLSGNLDPFPKPTMDSISPRSFARTSGCCARSRLCTISMGINIRSQTHYNLQCPC